MRRPISMVVCFALAIYPGFGQSTSFKSYMNPVIPGDHPDCTLTKIGGDFYTTGSSFNPTPVIYHSTDLVHWEAIAQPVSAAWANYGDSPSGGCWGGQVVYYSSTWWFFFSRSNQMYFVTAPDIRGSWTLPTLMNCPSPVPGLGYDNSIFIDDDSTWYLLVKSGQVNNWILQLDANGQPTLVIYNMCWINPAPSYPFSWAEGPVMWKHNGYYYYSFALNVAGGQKVLRSSALTDNQSSWVNLGDFFNLSDPLAASALFRNPNHNSAAIMIGDSTSWVVHPLWRNANNNEWYGQGRQGLLNQVRYGLTGYPTADYPVNVPRTAPRLPSSGIPWMVPHSDFFASSKLNPEWSFLGFTPENSHSLTTRAGWLTLSPKGKINTVIKNDGEHNYSIITRLHFEANSVNDQAGIWIFNGLQTIAAKLYCSIDSTGKKIVTFNYAPFSFTVNTPAQSGNDTLLLKLVRAEHVLSGYCSSDGYTWVKVGGNFNVADMDGLQPNYNAWTGNRQGLFVQGSPADFDFYIYRDAYTPILAECPANQYGTTASFSRTGQGALDNIHDGDWALYAGIEFGNTEYAKKPDSVTVAAACASGGGTVEIWLDSLDTGIKIAECPVSSTGSWSTFAGFTTNLLVNVAGDHDVYVKFKGTGTDILFLLQSIMFRERTHPETSVRDSRYGQLPFHFELEQNFPNPFNPTTVIKYQVPAPSGVEASGVSNVTLVVYDVLGREVSELVNERQEAGAHTVKFDGTNLASGVYLYRLTAAEFVQTRKMALIR